MADDSIRVLNQYKQHITRACSAKQQLKRLVEQHQTCLVQLQTQQLRLRKARAAAEEAINGHAALLLQQLRERCVDALRGVAQDYSLKQLPLDSSIAMLERSVRELESVAQQLYCGLHKATAADSVDHISSLTEGLYVAVQQGEAVVAQCGQSLTRPGGWPTAETFCGLQLASKRRTGAHNRQQLQRHMPGTPDLSPEWCKAADIAARGGQVAAAAGGKHRSPSAAAAAAAERQADYHLAMCSSRSSTPTSSTQYIAAGNTGTPPVASYTSSPGAERRGNSGCFNQQQEQHKVSLLPRQWRCKQRAQLRYQQHLQEQQEGGHMAVQQQQEQQQDQQQLGRQAALERLAVLTAAVGVGAGLVSAGSSCETDWGAALPPSAFPTSSTEQIPEATSCKFSGLADRHQGLPTSPGHKSSRAGRQSRVTGLLQASRQQVAVLTTDTASSDGPGSSSGQPYQYNQQEDQASVSLHHYHDQQQQHRQQQRKGPSKETEDPRLAVAASSTWSEPAAVSRPLAAAAAGKPGHGPPAAAAGVAAAAAAAATRGLNLPAGVAAGAAAEAGGAGAGTGPSGDIQGVQQQLAARSQVVQAAWEEVQQLAQRLSTDVLVGGLVPMHNQQGEQDRQPGTPGKA